MMVVIVSVMRCGTVSVRCVEHVAVSVVGCDVAVSVGVSGVCPSVLWCGHGCQCGVRRGIAVSMGVSVVSVIEWCVCPSV